MRERDEFLATVATLYYKLNCSQTEIAARFDISASQVSRLLKEARERNIVTIHVYSPIPRDFVLEQALIQRFGIKDAYVLQSGNERNETQLLQAVGRLAGIFLQRVIAQLPAGASVGIAWGTGVHAAINALPDNLAQHWSRRATPRPRPAAICTHHASPFSLPSSGYCGRPGLYQ